MNVNALVQKLREKIQLMGDPSVWLIVIFLCMVSIVEVYSASSRDTFGKADFWEPAITHARFLIFGLVLIWMTSKTRYMVFKVFSPLVLAISLGMLIYLAFGGGVTLNGGMRWIRICGITFQPSEIAKVSLIGTLSWLLVHFRDPETQQVTRKGAMWIIAVCAPICLLIFKDNISTAGIIACVVLMMCWIGRVWLKGLTIATLSIGGILAVGLIFLAATPKEQLHEIALSTGLHRLETAQHRLFGDTEMPADPKMYRVTDYNMQQTHSRIAVASSGLLGKGPGRSIQKEYLPMAFSDFIYSIILEEGGLVTGAIVLFLYLLLLYRSVRMASRCRNLYPAYLVMGLSLMLVLQALINMSVATGIFPVTGQPLPLVSKGGTSTLMTCLYFGMILSVSHTAKIKPEENEIPKNNTQI